MAVMAVTCAAADLAYMTHLRAQRAALWSQLEGVFSSYEQLDPPLAENLKVPHVALSLQLANDVVGLDSQRVGLTTGLKTREGLGALSLDMAHRLAAAPQALKAPVQLLVMADRRIMWAVVQRALGVAYALGVTRAQMLFTRGHAPSVSSRAPPEAAYALPRDFGAVDVELSDSAGWEPGAALSMDGVAPYLLSIRNGPVTLHVLR
jgi:hypothetical protein